MFLRRISLTAYETGDYLLENLGGSWLLRHGPSGQVVCLLGQDTTFGTLEETVARDQAFQESDQ